MPSEKITGVRMIAVEYMKKTLRQKMRLQRSSSRAEENAGEKQEVWSSFTCGVCRQALLIASELECRVVYLCSGKLGCMAKCACLLFMDIMFALDPV